MAEKIVQGRGQRDFLENHWKRAMGQIWSNRMRGLSWSVVKGTTDRLLAWLSKGVWAARQPSTWLDTKSFCGQGGLKPELADVIRMFKPKSLKEAFSLARMKDEQIRRQLKASCQNTQPMMDTASPVTTHASSMKWLSWDEMQKRRAQGLCFNCDAKYSVGHKCHVPQLLILEGQEQFKEESEFTSRTALPAV